MPKFIIASVIFLLINVVAAFALPQLNAYDWTGAKTQAVSQDVPKHTWTEWALMDFQKHDNPASIVFLGSSLVLYPLDLVDANFLNRCVDGATHHTSLVFDHLIHNDNYSHTTFDFALPGAMPSDIYLIANLLLQGKNRPDLVIYGVGPRDFLDNVLASPASTDPYRCLSKILWKTNTPKTVFSYIGQDWQSKLNYFLTQYLPLYGHQERISQSLTTQFMPTANSMVQTIANFTGAAEKNLPTRISMERLHKILPNYDPMAIDLNQCMFNPHETVDPNRFAKDLDEYRKRYRKVNWDIYTCQTGFFVDFLKFARDHNIAVLVVAMPITSTNRQMLPNYVFTAYKKNLRVLSKPFGAHFIDLDESGSFNDQDFTDTVHLNTAGGIKCLKLISTYVRQHGLVVQGKTENRRIANTGVKI